MADNDKDDAYPLRDIHPLQPLFLTGNTVQKTSSFITE